MNIDEQIKLYNELKELLLDVTKSNYEMIMLYLRDDKIPLERRWDVFVELPDDFSIACDSLYLGLSLLNDTFARDLPSKYGESMKDDIIKHGYTLIKGIK